MEALIAHGPNIDVAPDDRMSRSAQLGGRRVLLPRGKSQRLLETWR
jgi:hypothetical protein